MAPVLIELLRGTGSHVDPLACIEDLSLDVAAEFAKLAESPRAELDRQIPSAHAGDKTVAGTLEAVLWQMVAHNSYHAGQIALIRRALGVWPPRAGGDTW